MTTTNDDAGQPSPTDPQPATPDTSSRRDFIKFGGLAAAGLIVGGAAGAAVGYAAASREHTAAPPAPSPTAEPAFEHIVVLMGENRSFDNFLGRLYEPATLPSGAKFDGLAFGDYANETADGRRVAAHIYTGPTDEVMGRPNPDPGEEYPHVNTQLFDVVEPSENAGRSPEAMDAPFNAPPDGATAAMSGFVRDYGNNIDAHSSGHEPDAASLDQIMGGFSPEQLPVLSTLAQSFAVFDSWFCAVPSQTYCNRSFFHASTSHGFVTNQGGAGSVKWLQAPAAPTIFDRLEAAGLPWKVYFDEQQLISLTGMLHAPSLKKYWRTGHFVYMSEFYTDAAAGHLPAYAFIEPRMVYNHNDFHPPVGVYRSSTVDGRLVIDSAVSDVRAGERLVADVYDAIRTSAATTGSNALNTLLLITFDEHGGTYDHVPPPSATPPTADGEAGEMGFRFDRLGVRVPAIAVSAYTKAGTIVHDEMHHAAVIATLCRLHGLEPLTARDEAAADLSSIVNLAEPRHPSTWPSVQPMYVPANVDAEGIGGIEKGSPRDLPLSPPGRGLLGLLLAKYGSGSEPAPKTYADAYRILQEHGLGLFYPKTG